MYFYVNNIRHSMTISEELTTHGLVFQVRVRNHAGLVFISSHGTESAALKKAESIYRWNTGKSVTLGV